MGYVSVGLSHGCYAAVPVPLFPIWKEDPGPLEDGDGGLRAITRWAVKEFDFGWNTVTSDVFKIPLRVVD